MALPSSSGRIPQVALATSREYTALDADNRPLLALLEARGVAAVSAIWNDPTEIWADFDLVVIRSTWDYSEHIVEFLRWVGRLPRVLNPRPVVHWNANKQYLQDLSAAGLPVVPTVCIAPGEQITLGSAPLVVKPAVGASSKDIAWHQPGQEQAVQQHIGRLHAMGQMAIVQPYLPAVEQAGEIDLVFIGNEYSHAVRRGAILGASGECGPARLENRQRCEATLEQQTLAKRALEAVPGGAAGLLFARVDLLPTVDGADLISEVELVEPCLFLEFAPSSVHRLADRIAAIALDNAR